jgi:hypothetical protein
MKFALRNAGEADSSASTATYDSLEAARNALRRVLGWPDVQLGRGYTTANAKAQVWCAYRTRAEADLDIDGLHAPRIERVPDSN